MKPWNWDNLRFLIALADCGTLSNAANQLGVSHTTVQRRVRAFEAELQVQLFIHTPDGYHLTDAGQILYEQVHSLQDTVHRVSRQLVAREKELSGTVTVATTDTIGYLLMPKFIRDISEKHPELDVNLIIDNKLSDLSRLEADIAIRGGQLPQETLIGKKLGRLDFCLCLSYQYLQSIKKKNSLVADFSWIEDSERQKILNVPATCKDDFRFITLNNDYRGVPFNQWFLSTLPKGVGSVQTDGLMSAYALCKEGVGVALLPRFVVALESELIEIQIEEESPVPQSELWILSHAELRDSVRVKAVKQQLFEYLSIYL